MAFQSNKIAAATLNSTSTGLIFPLSCEQETEIERLLTQQYIERVKVYYPWKMVLAQSVLMIMNGLVLIALQIVLLVQKGEFNLYSGFWAGFFSILLSLLRLTLSPLKFFFAT